MSVERESITMRLVFGWGNKAGGWMKSARRCASVVEATWRKWLRITSKDASDGESPSAERTSLKRWGTRGGQAASANGQLPMPMTHHALRREFFATAPTNPDNVLPFSQCTYCSLYSSSCSASTPLEDCNGHVTQMLSSRLPAGRRSPSPSLGHTPRRLGGLAGWEGRGECQAARCLSIRYEHRARGGSAGPEMRKRWAVYLARRQDCESARGDSITYVPKETAEACLR